jgi:hypothetical protein
MIFPSALLPEPQILDFGKFRLPMAWMLQIICERDLRQVMPYGQLETV